MVEDSVDGGASLDMSTAAVVTGGGDCTDAVVPEREISWTRRTEENILKSESPRSPMN